MSNINDTFFDGHYKDIWRAMIPAELTVKEIDFMLPYFTLEPGNKVLDIMCGYGRHALALAKKGIQVTAVDNLADYISEIDRTARQENLPVKAVKTDVIAYKTDDMFDLAICMGNSLCFFNEHDTLQLLKTVAAHLKPQGFFLINTWMLAEIIFKDFRERSWSNVGELKLIAESKYYMQPSRIESNSLIISPDGKMEKKEAVDYIYSIAEMEVLLNKAGFNLKEVYSIPGRKRFTLGDPRAYIVAQKM